MTWTDTKTTGDQFSAAEYEAMKTYIQTASKEADYIISKSGSTITGYDLRDYSQVSSGTNAATVIQAVIDDAEAASNIRIHIKKGTYEIGTTLTVNGHIHFTGDGPEATEIKLADSTNADILQVNSANAATHYRPQFHGIKFDGNYANNTSGSAVVGYGIIESLFFNCHFEYPYDYGVHLYDTGGGSGAYGHHNRFIACLFDQGESSSGAGTGLYMRNNDENSIANCEFQYLKYGIYDQTGFNSITTCAFVDGQTGFYMLDASRTGINNCRFDFCGHYGIHMKGPFNNISNNTFYKCSDGNAGSYDCLIIDYYGCCIVTGNTFLAHEDGHTRYGLNENGNAAEDTKGSNMIIGNTFISMSTSTSLGTSDWASGALNETNTNYKPTNSNIEIDSSGVTAL